MKLKSQEWTTRSKQAERGVAEANNGAIRTPQHSTAMFYKYCNGTGGGWLSCHREPEFSPQHPCRTAYNCGNSSSRLQGIYCLCLLPKPALMYTTQACIHTHGRTHRTGRGEHCSQTSLARLGYLVWPTLTNLHGLDEQNHRCL